MSVSFKRHLTMFWVAVACVPAGAASQDLSSSSSPMTQECQRAQGIMLENDSGPERASAMDLLASECGTGGGEALARELLTMRAVTDTIVLNETVRGLIIRRHPRILAAAIDMTADTSAAFEARVAGLRTLVSQANPKCRVRFQDFAPIPEGMEARIYSPQIIYRPIGPADPGFPAGWRERTDSMLTRIEEDPAESELMQWAANRAIFYFRALRSICEG